MTKFRTGTDIDKLTQNVLNMLDDVPLQEAAIVAHVRRILYEGLTPCMKPVDRADWHSVDRHLAAIYLLSDEADTAFTALAVKIGLTGFDEENLALFSAMSTYRISLQAILAGHANMVLKGGIYRDGNADWYMDRLFHLIEQLVGANAKKRCEDMEKRGAEIRSSNRQAPGKGPVDSKGREGGEGPENGTPQAGDEGAEGVRQRRH